MTSLLAVFLLATFYSRMWYAAPLIVAMIATAAFGNWVGGRALNRIPERLFRVVFQILLTVLALRLLYDGFSVLISGTDI